nr:glycosyltransferase family 2 protein [uncultured Cellulosilyticum sp.]
MNKKTVYIYLQSYESGFKYLKRALDSIKEQTYENFVCLIYDNCSGSDTRDFLKEYVKEDHRFRLTFFDEISEQPIGWRYGIPEILALCNGKEGYYCRVDADDTLEPNCLETMINHIEQDNLDMVCGSSRFLDAENDTELSVRSIEKNIILEGELFGDLFKEYYQIMRTHWGKLIKLSVLNEMNLSNLTVVPYGADTLFVREALLRCKRVGIIKDVIYNYYLYNENRNYNSDRKRIIAPQILFDRDSSYLMQKCGEVSKANTNLLLHVYYCESKDVINLIISGAFGDVNKILLMYDVISCNATRSLCRIGYSSKYAEVGEWLINQDVFENEEVTRKAAEMFAIIHYIPKKLAMYDGIRLYQLLVDIYKFWDCPMLKVAIENYILQIVRQEALLQSSTLFFATQYKQLISAVLNKQLNEGVALVKEYLENEQGYVNKSRNILIELGLNIAALKEDERNFIYMKKKQIELFLKIDREFAEKELYDYLEILPGDKELLSMKAVLEDEK